MATRPLKRSALPGVAIDPFHVLFALYLSANLYALLSTLLGLPIAIENQDYTFSVGTLLAAGFAVFASLFACMLAFRAAEKLAKPAPEMSVQTAGAVAVLVTQLGFMAYNQYYDVNVAGVEDETPANPALRLIFAVAQPDLLFLIVGIGIESKRLFRANALVYCVSLLLRSWIGGLYLLAVVLAIRAFPLRITRRSLRYLVVLALVGAVSLPLIVSGKWFIRSGASVGAALDFLSEVGYSTYLFESLGYVVNRFQHIGHVSLIFEHGEDLNRAYEAGSFIPYWMDAAPQWLFMRIAGTDIVTFNKYIVQSLFDSNNAAYATHPGLAGWLFMLQYKSMVFALYVVAITFLPALLVRRYAGQKYFLLLACFCLIYLFHGWIGAYVNLVLYLLTFILVKRLARRPARIAGSVRSAAAPLRRAQAPLLGS